MSTLGPPDMPGSLVDMTNEMTIHTQEWVKDNSGAAKPQDVSTVSNIPCRLDKLSGAQALRHGYDLNEDVYRVLCPNVDPATGNSIVIEHNQYITIGGVQYDTQGGGRPEGKSGQQTVIVKRRVR